MFRTFAFHPSLSPDLLSVNFSSPCTAVRDGLARSIAQWAMEKGVSSFAHWFSPMRGACAEKVCWASTFFFH
jgi:hypothetical protein